MGLSISRTIVEAHHGRIWATRQLPRGTALHVMLPVRDRSSAAAQPRVERVA